MPGPPCSATTTGLSTSSLPRGPRLGPETSKTGSPPLTAIFMGSACLLLPAQHGVLEARADLVIRRMHRAVVVPDLPHRIAGAVVADQHLGLAHPERRPRQRARRQHAADLDDAADQRLVRHPGHVAT